MIPDRCSSKVYVEVCVAVLHPHKAVLLHKRLREEGVIWPIVLHPGHLPSHIRNLHQLRHPAGYRGETNPFKNFYFLGILYWNFSLNLIYSGFLSMCLCAFFANKGLNFSRSYLVSENSRLMRLRTFGRWGLVKYFTKVPSFILLSACRATSITSITLSPPGLGGKKKVCEFREVWKAIKIPKHGLKSKQNGWTEGHRGVQRVQLHAGIFIRANPEGNWHQYGRAGRGWRGCQWADLSVLEKVRGLSVWPKAEVFQAAV